MKLLFVYPSYRKIVDGHPELAACTRGYPWLDPVAPGLALPILAALTPAGFEIEFVDEQFALVPYDTDADWVAISMFTPQATRAYQIADRFQSIGKRVVLGGKHATVMTSEASQHADVVFVGEAELTWPRFLRDIQLGQPQSVYRGDEPPLGHQIPLPKRELVDRSAYPHDMEMFLTPRACRTQCQWCPIPKLEPKSGGQQRVMEAERLVEDLRRVQSRNLYVPDNLTQGATRARQLDRIADLFSILGGSGKRFMLAISPDELEAVQESRPALLAHLSQCGVESLYLTLNSFVTNVPEEVAARRFRCDAALKRAQDLGLHLCASIMMGFDYDEESIFDQAREFIERMRIDDVVFFLATPFPGSRMFDRLAADGRILHRNWEYYNCANVVFRPHRMSIERLLQGWTECWQWFLGRHMGALRRRYGRERPGETESCVVG